jgi:aspartyl protease family protein
MPGDDEALHLNVRLNPPFTTAFQIRHSHRPVSPILAAAMLLSRQNQLKVVHAANPVLAIAALVLAGVMPRVMGSVGNRPAPEAQQQQQPAKRAEPAPQTANYRTVTVRSDRLGHFQVEGSVDGRRIDLMVDTGALRFRAAQRDANRLGIFPAALDYTRPLGTATASSRSRRVRLSSLE